MQLDPPTIEHEHYFHVQDGDDVYRGHVVLTIELQSSGVTRTQQPTAIARAPASALQITAQVLQNLIRSWSVPSISEAQLTYEPEGRLADERILGQVVADAERFLKEKVES